MPVALHPTEVVKQACEFKVVPYAMTEDSMQSRSSAQIDSNVFPSPSFRQPDFPFQCEDPLNHSKHQQMLRKQMSEGSDKPEDLTSSMTELHDRNIALQSRIGNLESILR